MGERQAGSMAALSGEAGLPSLRRRPDRDAPRASPGQERLWVLDRMAPGNAAYNLCFAVRMSGRLEVPALERAVAVVVRRHESLRTVFAMGDGELRQIVLPRVDVRIRRIDLSGRSSEDRDLELRRRLDEDSRRPFDLESGPLLRVALYREDRARYVCSLVLHHIVADGLSIQIFERELSSAYTALERGGEPELEELPIQYADFSEWQRECLAAGAFDDQLVYWRARLGELPKLALPTDHPRGDRQTFEGDVERLELGPRILRRLSELSRQERASLFTTLLAAFQVLLARYSGQSDFAVGTPIANRSRPEAASLIGFLVNTIVLRANLADDPSFREHLARVRETVLEALDNQDLPFDSLVHDLRPQRGLETTPLFQVMFAYMHDGLERRAAGFPGVELEPLELHNGTARFDLHLNVRGEVDGERTLELEYNRALFTRDRIARLLRHYRRLLESVLDDPDRRCSALEWLGRGERRLLLRDFNDTARDDPIDHCCHTLFEQQVDRTPHREALCFEGDTVTRRELDQRANRLARHLRELGVGPDVLVGVFLERSIEMVVTLLAIMKAGGAYLPLDPSYPAPRVELLLADSGVPVLVTLSSLAEGLSPGDREVVALDQRRERILGQSEERPSVEVRPDHLAYVIYTSGSTGRPKGVMISHRAICNRLLWMQDAYSLTRDDRVLHKTPLAFDVSVWELFWPLLSGAGLVLARPEGHKDPRYLVDLVQREEITTIHFVPTLLRFFLEADGVERCSSLRRVIASGETLSSDLRGRFTERLGAELHNLYGPTEAAVDVTAWDCSAASEGPSVPIGRPISNTQVYPLDDHLEPVPSGVTGELYIGGVNVARGYLDRPGLTAERFIPDPFAADPGARLYRTGDLGRHRPDGCIEFLGRLDDQVKLRGVRIELGEIEAAIRGHPDVLEAAVLPRRVGAGGDDELVAYVVPRGSGELDLATRLRGYLARRLPEVMVPPFYVPLRELPLLPNGKLNRRALPTLQPTGSELEGRPRTPLSTEMEKLVASVWRDVLGIAAVGPGDTFWDLGSSSLKAVQAAMILEKRLGVAIAPTEMVVRTLGQIARECEARLAKEA